MKTFLIYMFLFMVFSAIAFTAGGATVYFADAWYFERHSGISPEEFFDAEKECRAENAERCSLAGGFVPDSYYSEKKFPIDQGI